MPWPEVILRRLNVSSVVQLLEMEFCATAELCLSWSVSQEARTVFHTALRSHLDSLLCSLHSRPVWSRLLSEPPTQIHPNSIVAFLATDPPGRVAESAQVILPCLHTGSQFLFAAAVLSRSSELQHRFDIIDSLLPFVSSHTLPPEVCVITLSALLATLSPTHPSFPKSNSFSNCLSKKPAPSFSTTFLSATSPLLCLCQSSQTTSCICFCHWF